MCPAMQQGFPFSHIGLHCLKVVSTQICSFRPCGPSVYLSMWVWSILFELY